MGNEGKVLLLQSQSMAATHASLLSLEIVIANVLDIVKSIALILFATHVLSGAIRYSRIVWRQH